MAYFYRYLMSENQIYTDMKRGYSFRMYDLHNTVQELVENSPFIEMESGYWDNNINELDLDEMTEDEILEALEDAGIDVRRDNVSGKWGLAYSGLSAFGEFDTAEDAEEAALEWHYDGFSDEQKFTHVAIVEGDITGSVDDNDIDTIRINRVIKIIAK